jgi:hypothetical protein
MTSVVRPDVTASTVFWKSGPAPSATDVLAISDAF